MDSNKTSHSLKRYPVYGDKLIIILFLFFLTVPGFSQKNNSPLLLKQTMERLANGIRNGSEILYGVPVDLSAVKGSTLHNSTWNLASILLNDGTLLEGYFVKLDIYSNELNILSTGRLVKILDGALIDSFVWKDSVDRSIHYFSNSLKFINSDLTGFTEILVDGPQKLFKNTILSERKPTYVVALDVGDKNTLITKKEHFYLFKDSTAYPVKNWKDITDMQEEQVRKQSEGFARKNNLSKSETDLCSLMKYVNQHNQ